MRYVADLHLHSRYAKAVSPDMTLETFARMARRKGIDVMGTGDVLQPEWLGELERKLVPVDGAGPAHSPGLQGSEAGMGWFVLREEIDGPVLAGLAERLRKPLYFVLSTEVHCAPRGTRELEGVHHLLWFGSLGAVRRFQERVRGLGDLREGRPRLEVSSRELLGLVREAGEEVRMAPAHVMNPYFSALGSVMKRRSLEEEFGGDARELLTVEMGLTSIPPMCRRVSSLDGLALFACSDAHSPENLGREMTIVESEPGFAAMLEAIGRGVRVDPAHSPSERTVRPSLTASQCSGQGAGSGDGASGERGRQSGVVGCVKYSIHRTRYFLNWCARCKAPWEGESCPRGHGRLVMGSRDYLERIADRAVAEMGVAGTPRFRMYVPVREVLMEYYGARSATRTVVEAQERLLREVGNELYVLTKATREEIAEAVGADLAERLVGQRMVDWRERIGIAPEVEAQVELF